MATSSSYGISEVGIWWKDVLSSTCSYLLTCKAKADNNPDIAAAVCVMTSQTVKTKLYIPRAEQLK